MNDLEKLDHIRNGDYLELRGQGKRLGPVQIRIQIPRELSLVLVPSTPYPRPVRLSEIIAIYRDGVEVIRFR